MRQIVLCDLDDTLIHTQRHYSEAREEFARFVSDRYNLSETEVADTQQKYSRSLLDTYGLSQDRFIEATEQAYRELVSDPDPEEVETVRSIGASAFKTADEYGSIGLATGGSDLLETARSVADEVWILTAGDPEIQNRKVEGLGLNKYVDTVKIVGMNAKSDVLSDLSDEFDMVTHIGNSSSSDVEAAEQADVNCIYVPETNWRNDPTGVSYSAVNGTLYTVDDLFGASEVLSSKIQN